MSGRSVSRNFAVVSRVVFSWSEQPQPEEDEPEFDEGWLHVPQSGTEYSTVVLLVSVSLPDPSLRWLVTVVPSCAYYVGIRRMGIRGARQQCN